MSAELNIVGFDKVNEIFTKLSEEIAGKIGQQAVKAATNILLDGAKARVPEGKTGKLADSLMIRPVKGMLQDGKIAYQVFASRSKGKGGWHAHLVEFGTKPHDIKNVIIKGNFYPLIHHPGAKPQPFLRPTVAEDGQKAVNELSKTLYEKAFRKLKKK